MKDGPVTVTVHDLSTVQRCAEAIKPSSEKNLMVVTRGSSENIGKLVRRVSNFYQGEKKEECHWIIVGVISRDSRTGEESLTDERLKLDPKHLARVHETNKAKVKANVFMKPARDTALTWNNHKVEVQP
ncbi:hypothetical protein V5O48_019221, partial [Marasmius crinis-equi]